MRNMQRSKPSGPSGPVVPITPPPAAYRSVSMGVTIQDLEGIVDQAAAATTPDERKAALGELSDKVTEAIAGHDSHFFTKAPARLRSLERFFAQEGLTYGEIPMMIRQLRFAQGRTRVEGRWQEEARGAQPTALRMEKS